MTNIKIFDINYNRARSSSNKLNGQEKKRVTNYNRLKLFPCDLFPFHSHYEKFIPFLFILLEK